MKLKLVSILTAVMLTLGMAMQCFAASTPFTDLDNIRSKDKILSLQERGYVSGIEDGIFAPNESITAAQGIQMIVKSMNINLGGRYGWTDKYHTIGFCTAPKATDYFKKADNNAWYANSFIAVLANNLEYPADLDPNANWTREEFTYYLITAMEKFAELPTIKLVPANIADEDQMESSFSGAIERALLYKVVSLDDKGNFNPKADITRAEAAEEVYNALEYISEHVTVDVD
jgi:S-layer homology domain.